MSISSMESPERSPSAAVVRSRTTGVPLELMTGGAAARAAGNVERGARAVWPTMFAYQYLYELTPRPS